MKIRHIIREQIQKILLKESTFMNVEDEQIKNHFQRQLNKASISRFAQFTAKDGNIYYIIQDNPTTLFKAYTKEGQGLKPIGYLYLHPNKDMTIYTPDAGKMDAVHVEPEYRRKGIAMALYDFAEKKAGLHIEPSTVQAPEIKAMWKKRKDIEEGLDSPVQNMYPDFFDSQFNPLRKDMPYPPKTGIVTNYDMTYNNNV